jgi:protoporphyrinogen/coproporphyrinogen III oxidase
VKRCAIIGGGISGLSTAYFLQKKTKDLQIDLYDSEPEPGGVIKTEEIEGCIVEAGPDSFLTQKRNATELCRELGLSDSLIGSNDSIRKTFIYSRGALRPLPEGFFLMVPTRIVPFLATDLISWSGKFSVLSDIFASPEEEDCSVADFMERRFGQEILDSVAEPLLSGIYGADVQRLSMKNALPQLWQLQKNGSILRSILRSRQSHLDSSESLFTSLRGGMGTLIKALREKSVDVRWKLDRLVIEIEKKEQRWEIGSESYDICVIAGTSIPEILTERGRQIRSIYGSMRRNSAVVTVLCFQNVKRSGFGWLVPAAERRSVLACTYVNQKFPHRAPENRLLVRVFMGGKEAEEWMERADTEIREEVLSELKRIAGIEAVPLFTRVFRWPKSMPEYSLGHETRIATLNKLAKLEGNLFLTGNLFAGVGIPDCIQHAEITASEIAESFS